MDDERLKSQSEASKDAEHTRNVLRATLASTPEIGLLNAIWAARAIQSNRSVSGSRFLKDVPEEACSSEITNPHAIRPWELELIANERLALPFAALFQVVDPMCWPQMATFVNLVRSLEGDEYAAHNSSEGIIDYLFKLGARQFEWQQGFLTKQEIFRSTFVYGQGACADYFQATHDISINTFTAVCFAYFSVFVNSPQATRDLDLSFIGIGTADRDKVLKMISKPLTKLKAMARAERRGDVESAFKPSVFRRFPLVGVTSRSYLLSCPLPDLLINRMTFGIFYDVIGGGGPVREEIGLQFEIYCHKIISSFISDFECRREFSYPSRSGEKKSPDLLIFDQRNILRILIECKASRLPLAARYADFDEKERGYEDMIKGVTQIWRFIADIRLGIVNDIDAINVLGSVITLDAWFVAAPKRQERIIAAAEISCTTKYPQVKAEDKIPISFVYMPELERALARSGSQYIFETFKRLSTPEGRGFSFDTSSQDSIDQIDDLRKFPFENEIASVLPWWGTILSMRKDRLEDG